MDTPNLSLASNLIINLREGSDASREVSHNTTSLNGTKFAVIRGVLENGQRYFEQYNLENGSHEKRPLQGGGDALVILNDSNFMAMTSVGKMQVFNMSTRQVVCSAQLPSLPSGEANSVKFWRFVTLNLICLFAADHQIYTWDLSAGPSSSPKSLFKLQDSLLSGQVVDIQSSEDAQWFAVVVRFARDQKQSVQLFAASRQLSSVMEASSAAVYSHKDRMCTIMALTSKGPQGYRLIVAELASQPGPAKFERLVLELPHDPSNSPLPVCLLLSGVDPNVLTVVTSNGNVLIANIEQRKWIATATIDCGNGEIFTGSPSASSAQSVVLSTSGSVIGISTAAASLSASATTVKPAVDAFQDLSLKSIVEPRKPQSPLEEFFAAYPPEAFSLYKNERAKFLPFFIEKRLNLNWQALMEADKDMSVASKLAFGVALAHMELASRSAIVEHFSSKGWLDDSHTKASYLLEVLGQSNSPSDADVQTQALITNLYVQPAIVIAAVTSRRLSYFDVNRVIEAAQMASQWDLVWVLTTNFEARLNLLSGNSMMINAAQLLAWYNALPADECLKILETLKQAKATSALSWERVAAPPNDRLAPHIDLTVSPPFQTLRVKIENAKDLPMWARYVSMLVAFGEAKELGRVLMQHYHDPGVNSLAEEAVKNAAKDGTLTSAMPLLVLAERSNRIEDLVAYYTSKPSAASFLTAYVTVIQPQNASRVIALLASKGKTELASQLILECAKTETLSVASLWLASNQASVVAPIANIINELSASNSLPLLAAYKAKFNP